MRWALVIGLIGMGSVATAAHGRAAPLYDPVSLNIGLNCQWQPRCMSRQRQAMNRALKYVRKYQPATWRVELCNHNAGRKHFRVDWIGFENCIRNANLRPLPPRPMRKRARKLT